MPPRPLIVRLCNWVGDVILALPSLRLLADHGHSLQLFGKGWAVPLLAGEAFGVHKRRNGVWANAGALRERRREALASDPGFDRRPNAVVLPTSFSSALEMRLAGLRAIGYAHEGRSPLLGRALPAPPYEQHMLMRYWTLACRFLDVEAEPPASIGLRTHPVDQAAADGLLASRGIRPGFIVVCPMAGGTFEKLDKRWPRFAEYSQQLRRLDRDIIACPGPGEASIIRDHHPGVHSLEGVSLGVYGGLMRRAALVVSNDTGPAHLAAAVDAPLLSVLGPTLPEQWAPWGPSVQVVRRWPEWPTVDEVMARTRETLAD